MKKFAAMLSSLALVLALSSPLASSAAPRPAVNKPAPRVAAQERHPEIRGAIRALERAKAHLEHAAHDFGGHRAEALEAVNNAIKQLQEALKYDKE